MKQHPYDRGIDRLFAVLAAADDPLTAVELGARAYLAADTLRGGRYLPTLRRLGLIHAAASKPGGRNRQTKAWAIGLCRDAKPKHSPCRSDHNAQRHRHR